MARKTKQKDQQSPGSATPAPLKPSTIKPRATGGGPFTFARYKQEIYLAIGLILVNIFIYWQTTGFQFVNFDDDTYIFNNPAIKAGLSPAGIWWALTTFSCANWHPLTWLSYLFDYQLQGLQPGWYHLVNLIIHCANSVLLLLVLRRMTAALWPSATVAALFAVHPLHVESVAWVAERKDVLSTLFLMLTLWTYLRYCETKSVKIYLITAALFFCGLMAKPMLVTVPFALLLLDYWPLARWRRQPEQDLASTISQLIPLIREKLPLFILVIISSLLTFIAQKSGGAVASFEKLPFATRMENAIVAYAKYLFKMCWPTGLTIFYPYNTDIPGWQILGAVLLLVTVTVLVVKFMAHAPYLFTGWFWYLGTLVPVIGIVQVGRQSMADRYTYIPLIGIFIIICWGLPELLGEWRAKRVVLAAAIGIILAIFTLSAFIQTSYWQDSITLFSRAVEVSANNSVAHHNLGYALAEQGKAAEALQHLTEAVRLAPESFEAQYNLARTLALQGRAGEAIPAYQTALKLKPDYAEAHFSLAVALSQTGKINEAIGHFNDALRLGLAPQFQVEAHNNLGVIYAQQGRIEEGKAQFNESIRIIPTNPDAHNNLGIVLMQQGNTTQAIAEFNEALRLKPGFANAKANLDAAQRGAR